MVESEKITAGKIVEDLRKPRRDTPATPVKEVTPADILEQIKQRTMAQLLSSMAADDSDSKTKGGGGMSRIMEQLGEIAAMKMMIQMLNGDTAGDSPEVKALREEVATLRRQQEQANLMAEIDLKIKAALADRPKADSEIIELKKSISDLATEWANAKESQAQATMEAIKNELLEKYQTLNQQIADLSRQPQTTNVTQQLQDAIQLQETIKKMVGATDAKGSDEGMSPTEFTEWSMNMLPKAAESISTFRNMLKPPPVDETRVPPPPPPLPDMKKGTSARPKERQALAPDIADYIFGGKEQDEGGVPVWRDKYGTIMINPDGSLMNAEEVMRWARTDPDGFRAEMEANIAEGKKRLTVIRKNEPATPEIEPPKTETPAPAKPEQPEKTAKTEPAHMRITPKPLPEPIAQYIRTHAHTTTDIDGKDGVLIGDYGEYWLGPDGKPMTPAELEQAMKSVPPDIALEQFNQTLEAAKEDYLKHVAENQAGDTEKGEKSGKAGEDHENKNEPGNS